MEGRIPPHSMEAEKSVLGAALLSEDALFDVVDVVKADDFYDKNHKEIFETVFDLHRQNRPVDYLTVAEALKKRGTLDMVGGRGYLGALCSGTPTTSNAEEYAKIVSEKAALRRLIGAADDIVVKGYENNMDATEMFDYAESKIFEISQKKDKGEYTHIKEILFENIAMIDKASKLEGGISGIPTGFKYLDEKLSGLQNSDLIILAARPAMGKTAFALTLALNAAVKHGSSVLIFSMEMSKEQLGERLLSMQSKVAMKNLKSGNVDRSDWENIHYAMDLMAKANINIDDSGDINVMEMKRKCRRLKTEKGLDFVIIDYLQLMSSEGKSDNRVQEVSAISRNLKLLAREIDCPVLVLSQLSRKPDERTDKRPMLSDLRESGSIEQDADVVIFLYRDEYYNPDTTEAPGECEVIVAKQRRGETGTVKVAWLSKYTRFVDSAANHA